MQARGIVMRKKTHPYCILFCLYSQKRKTGVSIDVYSKPKGRKTELKKKYRIANGKYLFILVGFAIRQRVCPVSPAETTHFVARRNNRFDHVLKPIPKICSLL